MRSAPLFAAILLCFGCDPEPDSPFPTTSGTDDPSDEDADGDGYSADEDCDDLDARAAPDEPEHCDHIDNDCDGQIDEGEAEGSITWFADLDNDGFGDTESTALACEPPPQYIGVEGDCDDEDPFIHPGAVEVCNEDDDDCDDAVDEDLTAHHKLGSMHAGLRELYGVELEPTVSFPIMTIEDRLTPYRFTSLATSDTGLLYAYDESESHLYVLDTCTGEGRGVGPINAGRLCGIAFGPGGALYGLDSDNDVVVTISTEDGSAEVVGPLGIDMDDCGLAYSCAKDKLYGAELPGNTMFEVNLNTGIAQDAVVVDVPFVVVGLEHHPDRAEFIAGTGTHLYALDDRTYEAREIGGLVESDDLAWVPECVR